MLISIAVTMGSLSIVQTHGEPHALAGPPPSLSLDEPFTGASLNDPSKWISLAGGTALEWPCLTARTLANGPLAVSDGSVVACETQGGPVDGSGDGVLRLTRRRPVGENPLLSGAGSLLYNEALSASEGIDISFSIRMDTTEVADGISFFLKDGTNTSNTIGAAGGALGYGIYLGSPGVPGALLGIGFDTFGSFSWDGISTSPACDGRRGSIRNLPQLAEAKSSIVLRGPDESLTQNGSAGYCYLDGVDVTYADGAFQRVRVKVDPYTPGSPTNVSVYLASHTTPNLLPTSPTISGEVTLTATSFKFGFSASTGYWSNDHEIRGLAIRPSGPTITSISSDGSGGSGTGPTAGGTLLTITGANLVDGATVTIGGQPCTNVTVSANGTQLTCETPAGSVGAAQVIVTNPNGGPGYGTFTYVDPAPTDGSTPGIGIDIDQDSFLDRSQGELPNTR